MAGYIGYKELDRMAEQCDHENAPYFLPFIFGERAPGWDDHRLGSFSNLRPYHTTADMYYAVLEGVLMSIKHNYSILINVMRKKAEHIDISGGLLNSPIWLTMASNILNATLYEYRNEHASLTGAIYVGLKAGGELPSFTDIKTEKGMCYYTTSDKAVKAAELRFEGYLRCYNIK